MLISVLLVNLLSCSRRLPTVLVTINGHEFLLEVARTDEEKEQGLKGRKNLGEWEGMLFVFDSDSRVSFWMKDTQIPLSIAFVSKDGVIKEIFDMKPFSLAPVVSTYSVRYAIELNAGSFAKAGIKPGDRVIFPEGFE